MRRELHVSQQQLRKFEARRFLSLAGGTFGAAIVGCAYSIAIALHSLQTTFGISQSTTATIGAICFCFQFFTLPSGLLFDRLGPSIILAIVTTLTSLGWILFACIFSGNISHTDVISAICLIILVGTTGWTDPAVNLNHLFVIPRQQSSVVILIKVFMGLGASLLGVTWSALYAPRSHHDPAPGNSTTPAATPPSNVVNYATLFCFWTVACGSIAWWNIFEAPVLKARRQTRWLGDLEHRASDTEILREHGDDNLLLPLQDERDIHNIEQSSVQLHENNNNYEEVARNDPTTNNVIAAAIIYHVPADTRVLLFGKILLAINLVYLTTAVIAMLMLKQPPNPHTSGLAIVVVAHALLFAFLLMAVLKYFIFPPEAGLTVSLPAIDAKSNNNNNNNTSSQSLQQIDHEHSTTSATENSRLVADVIDDTDILATPTATTTQAQDDNDDDHPQHLTFPNPYDDTLCEAMCGIDLWALFLSVLACWGGGAIFLANTVQIYNSLAAESDDANHHRHHGGALCVSALGLGSALGRILVGVLDEKVLAPSRRSASVALPLCICAMILSYILALAVRPHFALVFTFFLNGLGYGGSWAVILLLSRQCWLKDVAAKYMFLFASGVSSLGFAQVLGKTYDTESKKQHAATGHCKGLACVEPTLLTLLGATCLSMLVSIFFHWRWQRRNGLSFFGSVPVPSSKFDNLSQQ